MDKLHTMAEALLKYETIDQHQIDDIMSGAEPRSLVIGIMTMSHLKRVQKNLQ